MFAIQVKTSWIRRSFSSSRNSGTKFHYLAAEAFQFLRISVEWRMHGPAIASTWCSPPLKVPAVLATHLSSDGKHPLKT